MPEPRVEFREHRGDGYAIFMTTEVFRTPREREQGLRNRTSWIRATATFVFPEPTYPTFEMRDTLLPMAIVFVRPTGLNTGVIVAIEDGVPHVTVVRGGPAQWVIEMPADVVAQFGIGFRRNVTFVDVPAATE